jgi:hypothetical protein
VNNTRTRKQSVDPALEWSQGLKIQVGGVGTVAHAGIVLPRLVADRVGSPRACRAHWRRRGSSRAGTGAVR